MEAMPNCCYCDGELEAGAVCPACRLAKGRYDERTFRERLQTRGLEWRDQRAHYAHLRLLRLKRERRSSPRSKRS
jgi:hypothetical protein